MKLKSLSMAACLVAAGLASVATNALAQAKEQFFPVLSYRTGAYGPNGTPWANGYVDYLKLTNARGGINGVKISFEECETGYATDRGVECYERLKGKNGGATVFHPLSTGITFALTEKAPADRIPIITAGYGRSESTDGNVFKWNFPLTGTYWDAADIILQHIAKKEGGWDKLKGKKIAVVYHDSAFGLQRRDQVVAQERGLARAAQAGEKEARAQPLVQHARVQQAASHLGGQPGAAEDLGHRLVLIMSCP